MKRSAKLLILAAGLAFVVLAPLATAAIKEAIVDERVVKLFGGAESIENVRSPERIEAFRIDGSKGPKQGQPLTLGGYPVLAGPVAVDAATGKALATILLDANTYEWEAVSGCSIEPGVAVRFVKAGAPTEVLLCFSCDQMEVFRDGKYVGGRDDDQVRDPLLAIAKRLFPADSKIQALKTRRQLNEIAQAEFEVRLAQLHHATRHLKPSVREAIEKQKENLQAALKAAYPAADQQVLALLEFEGCSSNWTTFNEWQYSVHEVLLSYPPSDVEQPMKTALASDNRALRRGAVRLLQAWRGKKPSWKLAELSPAERRSRSAVRLDVLLAEPDYSQRQRAMDYLVAWGDEVKPADVARTIEAGLHDAEPGVRRAAMLAAGRLHHQSSVPLLLEILAGRTPSTHPAPELPQGETETVCESIEQVAGRRPEPEVAALALGLLGHAPAATLIAAVPEKSPMYEVALALLGQPERLRPEYFNGSSGNEDLQRAAVEAVVRGKGKYGLDYVTQYKMAGPGREAGEVYDQVKRMLVTEKAPDVEELPPGKRLADLRDWYERHGREYVARFKSSGK